MRLLSQGPSVSQGPNSPMQLSSQVDRSGFRQKSLAHQSHVAGNSGESHYPKIGLRRTANTTVFLNVIVWGALFGFVGCTPPEEKTFPVSGLVRFPDDSVLTNGSVEFEIVGRDPPITATGLIAADGTFTLGTKTLSDGAFAGKHRVAIIADYQISTGAERPGLIPESKLPEKYATFDRSGLVLEVLPENNQIIIDVEVIEAAEEE